MLINGVDVGDSLDKFDESVPFGAGEYIEPGEYIFEIVSCEIKKGHKGITFIGTNKLIHIMRTDEQGLVPGVQRNLVCSLTGNAEKLQTSNANIKGYLLAACEGLYQRKLDPKAVKKEFIGACCGVAQPLAGVLVKCEAFKKEKAKAKGEFYTAKNWKMLSNAELAAFGRAQPAAPAA